MTQTLQLLFDENIGRPPVAALHALCQFQPTPPNLKHVSDVAPPGTPDDERIPKIAAAGWVVITADRAKQAGGPKLPDVCVRLGVTHILLSHAVHQARQFDKARAVLAVWDEIVAAAEKPPGTRMSLRYTSDRRAWLVEVPV